MADGAFLPELDGFATSFRRIDNVDRADGSIQVFHEPAMYEEVNISETIPIWLNTIHLIPPHDLPEGLPPALT